MTRQANLHRRLVVCIAIAVAVFGWFAFRTFSNPDMTRTRLLTTFWYEYVIGLAVMTFAYLAARD